MVALPSPMAVSIEPDKAVMDDNKDERVFDNDTLADPSR